MSDPAEDRNPTNPVQADQGRMDAIASHLEMQAATLQHLAESRSLQTERFRHLAETSMRRIAVRHAAWKAREPIQAPPVMVAVPLAGQPWQAPAAGTGAPIDYWNRKRDIYRVDACKRWRADRVGHRDRKNKQSWIWGKCDRCGTYGHRAADCPEPEVVLPAAATKRAKEKAMGMAKAKRAKGSIASRSIGLKKRAGTAKKA